MSMIFYNGLIGLQQNIFTEAEKMKVKKVEELYKINETGVTLIAEGIETDAELECLHRLAVHYGQGYFLGRPNKGFESVSEEAMGGLQKLNIKLYN